MNQISRVQCVVATGKRVQDKLRKEATTVLAAMTRESDEGIHITLEKGKTKSKKESAALSNATNGKSSKVEQMSLSKKTKKTYEKEKAAILMSMSRESNEGVHASYSQAARSIPGSSSSTSQVPTQLDGDSNESSVVKVAIEFDGDGQPVGNSSDRYASYLGRLTRTHCSISYESFKDVPKITKELIWKKVKDEYIVAEAFKKCMFKKVAKHFREYKHLLRINYYDKYDTEEERKSACPRGVRQEDWEKFVDNEVKLARKLFREKGRTSRMAVKALHTSGRRGSARTIHNLKKKESHNCFTGTAIHTRKDGTFIASEKMERVKAIVEADPSSTSLSLDEDPVAQVYGIDRDDHVRGFGIGISKASLSASAPTKENFRQATQKHIIVENRLEDLESQVNKLTKHMNVMVA